MRKWVLARNAATARSYVVSPSRRIHSHSATLCSIQSQSTPPSPSPTTSFRRVVFPQIFSYLCCSNHNTRFFSQHPQLNDAVSEEEVHRRNSQELNAFNEQVEGNATTVGLYDAVSEEGSSQDLNAFNEQAESTVGLNAAVLEVEVYEIDAEKLESAVRLLENSADGSLETNLDGLDFPLHQEFVMRIIGTASISCENLVRFVKWAWSEKSLKITTLAVESLVTVICGGDLRRKEVYAVWDLVKEIGEKESGVVNVRILNNLIAALLSLGKAKAARQVFDEFEAVQCPPDGDSYYLTIEALCKRSNFDAAWGVCEKMIDARVLPDDGEKVGKIMCWFCKGRKVKEAHALYKVAMERKKQLPMSSFNFLVAKLCQENEMVQLALEMLNDIPEEKQCAIKPYSAVVRALCRIKDVDAAKQLVLKMVAEGPPPGNAVFNSVITGYSKVGEMGQALEMVKLLDSRGLKPDVYAYTVIMSGYSNGGEMEEARKVLEEAKKKHSKLTPVMYHTLIRGYCKLEQFDEALKLLSEMKDFGVRPNADEYDKLIQSLCLKALDWEKAEKLHEEMKENGLYLKGITRGLICAVKEMEKEVVEAGNFCSAT